MIGVSSRDAGRYGAEDGVSATTLLELFRLPPMVWYLPFYVERVAERSQRRRSLVSKL